MHSKQCHFILIVIFLNLGTHSSLWAQNPSTDLSTPNKSIYNHLFYLQSEQYDVNQSSLSFALAADSIEATSSAVKLKQILDSRGHYVYMSTVPDKPDYRDTLTGRSIYIPFPDELPEVYLEKLNSQWLYSEETINQIPSLYKKTYPFGSHKLVEYFGNSNQQTIFGVAVWQFVLALVFFFVAFLIYRLLSLLIHTIYGRLTKTRFSKIITFDKDNRLSNPLSVVATLYLIRLFLPILQLDVRWSGYLIVGLNIAISIILGLVMIRLVDVLVHYFSKYADSTESKLDEQLMPILEKLLKSIIFIVTLMYVLSLLHVNITALIAGVSIGGLALALAAQDTVKNFIGSLMIFIDAPFQIGDYIIVSGMEGTVVEVGFRSTKIQTIDSSIITIPNGTLSNNSMVNKGMRKSRLFNTTLTLTYQTKPAKIKTFIAGLKSIIMDHTHTDKTNYYVHLINLNSSSIDVLFRTKLNTLSYDEELVIKEELLFSIIELAEDLGVDFAFPSQSIYIEGAAPKV